MAIKFHLGDAFRIPRLCQPIRQLGNLFERGVLNAGLPWRKDVHLPACSGRIDGEEEEFFQYNEMGVAGQWRPECFHPPVGHA